MRGEGHSVSRQLNSTLTHIDWFSVLVRGAYLILSAKTSPGKGFKRQSSGCKPL